METSREVRFLYCICVFLMSRRLEVIGSHLGHSMSQQQPPLTTHVLNTSTGLPAANLSLSLHRFLQDKWTLLNESSTNTDGRCPGLSSAESISPGRYKLRFETGKYFAEQNVTTFYPFVEVVFDIEKPNVHYHVPLLLSPYGYSTYRGS